MKIGIGYDVHELTKGRNLIIGGVKIPYEKGLLGHSDADVLIHAIMDAIIGALGLGDIGKHFPDTDNKYKNIDSLLLLDEVYKILKSKGYKIQNLDGVIIAQRPKMAPYIEGMKKNIANILRSSLEDINIKATTEEGLGFTGREEGIASQVVVLLVKE
ncbi:2-C-methyl-D-erythritol 2,4-cyclodiphosphate synthase [Alkalibaculum sp. M08DMB]|uniref:2-C-methyl-D-erythritol 2,4-cyclodiphosphate synthase n=1 Tax=Alkalibaculum sporogenes TaxID=2655001 RepID=A0A6A7K6A2_9FIRM|nr:2-C-methyl-D-erythritol 2,4-cyclodiphosphate synthase [Alkalibaculum sporogenes]MPW24747.1 2-C-methyl-D-erythritol 2,4-cyclodiphosphate synthase [Alkalibaculum sporogenes]